ncbi:MULTISPECIES: hypothetical protein [unclassified Pseudomonas]|uniref:hypothetical protein n=1 Tax=unclassified Pseudomonas TaxID=196821 RepID=UPI002447899A|nr:MULTISPECIES: hypothetical protein [unclassified Pseudomonas]MDG9927237.1 hypothetical protein [Pseudomonas sp. GD04042]MDH0485290.1 hypothetical protein [Pseudomonas sp. GD04015]MDH0602659.1 hypothetical protein [Pseudomonas sp. GD03869]
MFRLARSTLYLKLGARRLSGLHLPSGKAFDELPMLAIEHARDGSRKGVAMGTEALKLQERSEIRIVNGFDHPRTLLADFPVAEQTMKLFLRRWRPRFPWNRPPVLVLHPRERLEGGLTQVEIRAFTELFTANGIRTLYIWTGRELTPEELRDLAFPTAEGTLIAH